MMLSKLLFSKKKLHCNKGRLQYTFIVIFFRYQAGLLMHRILPLTKLNICSRLVACAYW